MKKRLTRYFYDFKVAKGTVIYGESNKSANLMPSLQACGSALFGIESNFVEEHPNLVREYEEENDFDKEKEIKLYTNDKAGKSGRARWYITSKKNIKVGREYMSDWKVVVSSANAGGQKRSNQLAILDNYSVFGRARVALKIFKTEKEARNFYQYVRSELIRFAFLMTDESLTSLAKQVPDVLDYSGNYSAIAIYQ